MFGEPDNFLEFLRAVPTPVGLLLIVPIVMLAAPLSPVCGMHEFPVFRMQQYDLNGIKYGSRSAVVNLEARPFSSGVLNRRCGIAQLADLSIDKIKAAIDDGLGALLVLLPQNLSAISADDLLYCQQLEIQFLEGDIPIPVYFAHETEETMELYQRISESVTSDAASSAVQALKTVASANAFHLVSAAGESKQLSDFPIISLQGKLVGQGLEENLPTLAIVAHYDAFGFVPKLSKGANANGSGVVAFLELARILSSLYEKSSTRAKFNLLFFMAGGGKFNYQGTRKWIDENLEATEISLLSEVDYVICLDTLGKDKDLFLHVSKPPKENTPAYFLMKEIENVMSTVAPVGTFKVVHKKINLADDVLSWEHERFSLRRIAAGTFSESPASASPGRSVFDTSVDVFVLERNIRVIGEGLVRYIFNLSGKGYGGDFQVLDSNMGPQISSIRASMEHLSTVPRSAQLITKDHALVNFLEQTMSRYLKDVKRVIARADRKDPEFVFYDVFDTKLSVYSVKPAVFDLFLATGIAIYLGLAYVVMENFAVLTEILPKPISNGKVSG